MRTADRRCRWSSPASAARRRSRRDAAGSRAACCPRTGPRPARTGRPRRRPWRPSSRGRRRKVGAARRRPGRRQTVDGVEGAGAGLGRGEVRPARSGQVAGGPRTRRRVRPAGPLARSMPRTSSAGHRRRCRRRSRAPGRRHRRRRPRRRARCASRSRSPGRRRSRRGEPELRRASGAGPPAALHAWVVMPPTVAAPAGRDIRRPADRRLPAREVVPTRAPIRSDSARESAGCAPM